MISLSSETFDVNGALLLPFSRISNTYESFRRGSVTATLDGGCSVYDTGYSITDLTLRATLKNVSQSTLVTLQYLVSHYTQLICCIESGCFLVIPSFTTQNNQASLSFRIIDQLDS